MKNIRLYGWCVPRAGRADWYHRWILFSWKQHPPCGFRSCKGIQITTAFSGWVLCLQARLLEMLLAKHCCQQSSEDRSNKYLHNLINFMHVIIILIKFQMWLSSWRLFIYLWRNASSFRMDDISNQIRLDINDHNINCYEDVWSVKSSSGSRIPQYETLESQHFKNQQKSDFVLLLTLK